MKPFNFLNLMVVVSVLAMYSGVSGSDAAQLESEPQAPGRTMAQQAIKTTNLWITTDHSKHEILKQQFASGPEVTRACLTCHSEAADQFHKTIHWTWLDPGTEPAKKIGKAGYSINNFCISVHGSWPRCTSCHAGYGWKDADFNFSDPNRVTAWSVMSKPGPIKSFRPVRGTRSKNRWYSREIKKNIFRPTGTGWPRVWAFPPAITAEPVTFSAAAATGSSTATWILR